MDWVQTFTIIGVLGGFLFFILQRLEKDMDKMNTNIDASNRRLDGHAQRIDQLYHMFVDLLKERR
jgi:hypothetical protein